MTDRTADAHGACAPALAELRVWVGQVEGWLGRRTADGEGPGGDPPAAPQVAAAALSPDDRASAQELVALTDACLGRLRAARAEVAGRLREGEQRRGAARSYLRQDGGAGG